MCALVSHSAAPAGRTAPKRGAGDPLPGLESGEAGGGAVRGGDMYRYTRAGRRAARCWAAATARGSGVGGAGARGGGAGGAGASGRPGGTPVGAATEGFSARGGRTGGYSSGSGGPGGASEGGRAGGGRTGGGGGRTGGGSGRTGGGGSGATGGRQANALVSTGLTSRGMAALRRLRVQLSLHSFAEGDEGT